MTSNKTKKKSDLEAEVEQLRAQLSQTRKTALATVTVRIPLDLRDAVKTAAAEDDRELQGVYADALKNWLRARTARQRRRDGRDSNY